jgi:hypothetical protein
MESKLRLGMPVREGESFPVFESSLNVCLKLTGLTN